MKNFILSSFLCIVLFKNNTASATKPGSQDPDRPGQYSPQPTQPEQPPLTPGPSTPHQDPPAYEPPPHQDPPAYEPPHHQDPPAYEPPHHQDPPAYEPPHHQDPPVYEPPYQPDPPVYEPPYQPDPPAYEPPYQPDPPAYEPPYQPDPPAYEPPAPPSSQAESATVKFKAVSRKAGGEWLRIQFDLNQLQTVREFKILVKSFAVKIHEAAVVTDDYVRNPVKELKETRTYKMGNTISSGKNFQGSNTQKVLAIDIRAESMGGLADLTLIVYSEEGTPRIVPVRF